MERKIYISPFIILTMKKATSIKIEPELLKELKKYCIDHDITLTAQLEKLIKLLLKKNDTRRNI